jgi:copper resistance protein C
VLVKSSPPARETLAEAPTRVDLWFNERLEPAYSRVSVVNGQGVRVDLGIATVSPDDAKRLSVSLPTLGPGRYTVHYRVLSVDGHVVESSLDFTIRRRPTP